MTPRVLVGHIDLGMVTFPPGIKGSCLDCLARRHLWSVGLDYEHCTGHGIGSYMNVVGGPCRIVRGTLHFKLVFSFAPSQSYYYHIAVSQQTAN